METPLSIKILFEPDFKQEAINYFTAYNWTKETESILIQHILDLLDSIKPVVKSLQINFNIEVSDASGAGSIITKVMPGYRNKKRQKLTGRESEVFNLIKQGFTNIQIAKRLFISFETVKSHRKNILSKTHCKNTASLIDHFYNTPTGK